MENEPVWVRYDDTWYAGLVMPPENAGTEPVENQKCVLILDEEQWGANFSESDIIPFDYDETRLADPKAEASIRAMCQLLNPQQVSAEGDEEQLGDILEEAEGAAPSKSKKEKKEKKDKKDKKTRKEERKREKERKKEEKRASKKRNRSPSPGDTESDATGSDDEDDGEDVMISPRRDAQDDDLEHVLRHGETGVSHRGEHVVVSRLHDRNASRGTGGGGGGATQLGASDIFCQSAPPSVVNALVRARNWYQSKVAECKSTGRIMSMQEVELLRAVDERQQSISLMRESLHRDMKLLSGSFKRTMKAKVDALDAFDVELFCEELCPLTIAPPLKPEKRKGPRYFALDASICDLLLGVGKPMLMSIDPDLQQRMASEEATSHPFAKSGLKTKVIMKQWRAGRELVATAAANEAAHFDVQPVAAHGAVSRKFNEFTQQNRSRALAKAERSHELKTFVDQTGGSRSRIGWGTQNPRDSIGSFFNFNDFHAYNNSISQPRHDRDYSQIAEASATPADLPLEFDPDATFHADNELAAALQAFEQSGLHYTGGMSSSQRSQTAFPSDQSMWAVESVASSVGDATEAAPVEPAPRTSTSSAATTVNQRWASRVTQIVIERASLFVKGSQGRPKLLPPHQFDAVVRKCVQLASNVQNKRDRTIPLLAHNDATWELTTKDELNIAGSVEHYIRRKFPAPTDSGHYHRTARSASRQAVYDD